MKTVFYLPEGWKTIKYKNEKQIYYHISSQTFTLFPPFKLKDLSEVIEQAFGEKLHYDDLNSIAD